MSVFEKVCIAGTGALGQSLGRALRVGEPGVAEIIGWDRRPERMEQAMASGALTGLTAFPQDELEGADLVLMAVGVEAAVDVLRRYGRFIEAGALVVDFGARYKGPVFEAAAQHLSPDVAFVGARLLDVDSFDADPAGGRPRVAAMSNDVAFPASARALLNALGGEVVSMRVDEHDMAQALHNEIPRLLALASVTTRGELSEGFEGVDAARQTPLRALEALHEGACAPEAALTSLRLGRGEVLSVLGRTISVLQDLRGWMELGQWDRVEALMGGLEEEGGEVSEEEGI